MIRSLVKCSFCAIGVILFSCGDPNAVANADTTRNTSLVISPQVVRYGGDSFLLDSFKVLIDSFFTAYSEHEWDVPYRVDTLIARDTTYQSRRYTYKPVNGSYAYWHYFGEMDRVFELAECCYPDPASAEEGWKEFHRLSGPDPGNGGTIKDDQLPCLSSGQDVAFRTGNKIFWLCTYCNWDERTGRIMESLLRRTIINCGNGDEIRCKCFGVKPL